ncbi:MAG: RNA methyltransferase [Lachnospiraceae bacterium]|nr:RNA methyltransferase [Lachnospiraceae bacterium]
MITSMSNKNLKMITGLLAKAKERKSRQLFVTEGIKMFLEAPQDRIRQVYISEELERELASANFGDAQDKEHALSSLDMHKTKEKLSELRAEGVTVETVVSEVFKKVCDTVTPQGILCVVTFADHKEEDLRAAGEKGLYLVLEDVQDPGNLGTIIRAGEGAGLSGVILSKGCVDIYNPKVVRATMGSIYRVPFLYKEDIGLAVDELKKAGVSVFAAELQAKDSYDRADYLGPVAFLLGNEGKGLSKGMIERADHKIIIPMLGQVESLNVAVAANLLLYEVARQRRGNKNL